MNDEFFISHGFTPREVETYALSRLGMNPTAIGRLLSPQISWYRVKQILAKVQRKVEARPERGPALEAATRRQTAEE